MTSLRKKYLKSYRKSHPKYRNARRKANYHKNRPPLEKTKRRPSGVKHALWTWSEIDLICESNATDKEISYQIDRSVQAIQQKRYQLNKQGGHWSKQSPWKGAKLDILP